MPINTNDWTTYVNILTNHQHFLAQQIINAYNHEFKLTEQHQKLGYHDDNKIALRLNMHLKIQTAKILKQWRQNLNPQQQRQWQKQLARLTNYSDMIQAVADVFCLKHCYLKFTLYQKYYPDHHATIPQPEYIQKLVDMVLFFEKSFQQVINNGKQVS